MAAKKITPDNLTFLSINEVAQKLASHPKTIAKLIRSGSLESVKVGKRRLISLTHFRRYIEAHMTEGSLE